MIIRRLIRRLILAALLLAVLAAAAVYFAGNALLRAGLEYAAGRAAGTPAKVGSASIGWLDSRVSIGGFVIGNPPGYAGPEFARLERGRAAASPLSLLRGEIAVSELTLEGLTLTLEVRVLPPGSNLTDVLAALKSRAAGAGPGRRFRLEKVVVRRLRARLLAPGVKAAEKDLPDFELRNVRSAAGGPAALEDILFQVLSAAGRRALEKEGLPVPAGLRGLLDGGLDGLGDVLREVLR